MMGNFLRWVIVISIALVAGGGLYQFYENTRPCVQPVSYAIGAVDARFGVSDTQLATNAKAAAEIWNAAAGKTVLSYDPAAKMKINLIYDEREANTKLGNEISRKQADADAARAALDALQAQYAARQSAYNQEVDAVNARGGATPAEAATLAEQRDSLNVFSSSINRQVSNFNKRIADLNAAVAEFNKSAGRTFEAGQYIRDSEGERINIFAFIDMSQLRRVLAHEFGHALSLDHNDDPKSIMFAKNESGNLVPTESDLAALRAICGA